MVCVGMCIYVCGCGFVSVLRLPWILDVAQKYRICSSSAFSGSDGVCVCVFVEGGNESQLAGSATVRKKKSKANI